MIALDPTAAMALFQQAEDAAQDATPGMVDITVWEPGTGRIVTVSRCLDIALDAAYPGMNILRGSRFDAVGQYIDPDTGTVLDRPVMAMVVDRSSITADGADGAEITGIPEGATLKLYAQTHTVTGGTLAFSTVHPGHHLLRFEAFPFQPAEVVIHAS